MARNYSEAIARGKAQHGDKFNPGGLAQEFRPYYESGRRVRVRFSYGEELTGTIGMTGGWLPVFLLMRTSRSIGSSWTLSDRDHVVAVKTSRGYEPVKGAA